MRASRIIVSRTDNVGDVVLALPMVGILREHLPSSDILFLGRSYTRAVIESCEHVDGFLNWDDVSAPALGIHAIGLYAPMRPRHPGRWAPVGAHTHALVFDPSCERCRKRLDCNCIQAILEPLADHPGGSRGGALDQGQVE